jgi:hypothetical protein
MGGGFLTLNVSTRYNATNMMLRRSVIKYWVYTLTWAIMIRTTRIQTLKSGKELRRCVLPQYASCTHRDGSKWKFEWLRWCDQRYGIDERKVW